MLPPAVAFLPEITFQTSRSSGPGGQNVNKVESRVELRWHLLESQLLSDSQKALILEKIANQLTAEGLLLITAQDDSFTRPLMPSRKNSKTNVYAIARTSTLCIKLAGNALNQ